MKKLDWTRLLGFEQVASDRETISTRMGGKVGEKVGSKLGSKLGAKAGVKALIR